MVRLTLLAAYESLVTVYDAPGNGASSVVRDPSCPAAVAAFTFGVTVGGDIVINQAGSLKRVIQAQEKVLAVVVPGH